jgi:excisionase family DNA binding protein
MERANPGLEGASFLDSYRLMSGAVVDLREVDPAVRAFVADLALRLAQGHGYKELINRVLQHDSPIYGGVSPLASGAQELAAVKVAHDLVYRAGVAEGTITPKPGEAGVESVPQTLRQSRTRLDMVSTPAHELTTEKIVTVGEAMNILGITRQAVINSVRAGKIRGEQHGRLWILARDDVLKYRETRARRKNGRS